MSRYAVVDGQNNIYAIWRVDIDSAQQLFGTLGPQQRTYQALTPNPGETPFEAVQRVAHDLYGDGVKVAMTMLSPGEYYPRIARPSNISQGMPIYPGAALSKNVIAIATGQLAALTAQLQRICQTIHPEGANLDSYGHDSRNLLILACTEVEAHWRGVLQANGETTANNRFTTCDYVKLCGPLHLHEYSIVFPYYPWLAPESPFAGWLNSRNPTRDLPWYDAYNLVKHDRESNFAKAILKHAIQAVTACAVMMLAQYGDENVSQPFFSIERRPLWILEEFYISPYLGNGIGAWIPRKYVF